MSGAQVLPRLNRRLTLEERQRLGDGAGGFTEHWQAKGVLWAEVIARSGRAGQQAGAPLSDTSYRITVRAAPVGSPARPHPEHRFRDGSRIFDIQAVAESERDGRYLTCFANEEVVI